MTDHNERDQQGFIHEAHCILKDAIREWRPKYIFGLFSGGHDSLCSTHILASCAEFTAAVHINTGVGVEETRQFVRDTCAVQGWPLLEYHPPPFIPALGKRKPGIDYKTLPTYEAITLHHGFCGPGGHRLVYNRLKERCIRQLVRDHKRRRGDRIMLVGGMRQAESVRRMGNAVPVNLEGARVWVAPLVYWTSEDKEAYLAAIGLTRNPVVTHLCMSGECLCGAFAKPQELVEVARHYPRAAEYIRSLEIRAKASGVHCVWGTRPPGTDRDVRKHRNKREFAGLCWSCANKWCR